MEYKSISFVIPVYNESQTLRTLLDKVLALELGLEKQIVVVDDCSHDHSFMILEEYAEKYPDVFILQNDCNSGKSQTVKKGIMATTGDLVVIQDADLEYEPQDLVAFVEAFQSEGMDVVYGNRFGKDNKVIYWQNWIGNSFVSLMSSLLTGPRAGMWTRDMEVCYKMAKGEIFRDVAGKLQSTSRFGLEPEITARFSKYRVDGRHLKFKQLPISYFPRTIAEGKKMHAFRDGFKALWEIFRYNLLPN